MPQEPYRTPRPRSCGVQASSLPDSSAPCALPQTYHTLKDMRVVFLDGTVLDTADPDSRAAFLKVPPATSLPTPAPLWIWPALRHVQELGDTLACPD